MHSGLDPGLGDSGWARLAGNAGALYDPLVLTTVPAS